MDETGNRYPFKGPHYRFTLPDGSSNGGHTDPTQQWQWYRLPESVSGLKVYDYGTWDGGLAIEAVRRGAVESWGLDCFVWEMWPESRDIFDRNVRAFAPSVKSEYVETEPVPASRYVANTKISTAKLTLPQFAKRHGPADLVIAAGVFYHLKNPYQFVEDLTLLMNSRSLLYLTTWCLSESVTDPVMRFARGWRGDDSNYWLASLSCVREIMGSVGMQVVDYFVLGEAIGVPNVDYFGEDEPVNDVPGRSVMFVGKLR